MACVFEIAFPAEPSAYLEQAARAAFAELDRLEGELSRFVPSSDIARLNALKPGESLRLGPDAKACLLLAERYRRRTKGAFDVSAPAGVRADLGGIGKGYALDRLGALLADWETGPVLLQAAQSTALALPAGARQSPVWKMKLRDPANRRRPAGAAFLRRGAFSGSGTGLRGSHIFDPATGKPRARRPAAWAAASTAAQADAFSTAFMVLPEAAIKTLCGKCRETAAVLPAPRALKVLGRASGVRFEFLRENP